MARHKLEKTNAIRLLEAKHVAYEALTYDAAIHSAVSVAEALGVPAEQVYKTLVVLCEERGARPLLVMIAGPEELDLRLLARSIGTKAARMAPHRDAERLTGLQVGGIGALALVNRPFEPCIERAALDHEWVLVNGGRRGLNLRVGVQDLIRLTGARVVDAVRRADALPTLPWGSLNQPTMGILRSPYHGAPSSPRPHGPTAPHPPLPTVEEGEPHVR